MIDIGRKLYSTLTSEPRFFSTGVKYVSIVGELKELVHHHKISCVCAGDPVIRDQSTAGDQRSGTRSWCMGQFR